MSPWVTIAVAVIGSGATASLVTLLSEAVKRRWKKADEQETENTVSREEFEELKSDVGNIREANCAWLEQNIRYLAMCYIADKEISIDDKEAFHRMHAAFKANGGEDLDVALEEVDKLPVKEPRFKKGEDK